MRKLIAMMMVVAVAAIMSPAYGDVVSHWDFHEGSGTAVGDVVDGNDGTLNTNGTDLTWTADGGGRTGQAGDYAIDFSGYNHGQNVSIADADNLDISSVLTLEAWIKPDEDESTHIGTTSYLIIKPGAYQLNMAADRTGLALQVKVGGSTKSLTVTGLSISSTSWTHVKAYYDSNLANNNMKIFMNGSRIGQQNQTGAIDVNVNGASIGYADRSANYKGLIDDVKIWNTAPAVSHWDFHTGSGTTAYDIIDSSNGTLNTNGTDLTWTADGGGRTGQAGDYALDFSGYNHGQNVSISDTDNLDVSSALALEAWIKPDEDESTHIGTTSYLIIKPGSYQLNMGADRTSLTLQVKIGGSTKSLSVTGLDISYDSWTHVVASYDSSLTENNMKIYMDGLLIGQQDQAGLVDVNANDVSIGYADRSANFKGLIDDVKIWNTAVPEPATMVLLGLGGVGLLIRRRRRA
jgi:hypothetical protein